jgi:hypothetical protein
MEQIETIKEGFWFIFNHILQGNKESYFQKDISKPIKDLQDQILKFHKALATNTDISEKEQVSSELLYQIVRCNEHRKLSIELSYCPAKPWDKPKLGKLVDYVQGLDLLVQLYGKVPRENEEFDISLLRQIDDKLWEVLTLLLKFIISWNHCTLRELALLKYKEIDPKDFERNRLSETGLFNTPPIFR